MFGIRVDNVDSSIINITRDGEDFAWFLSDIVTDKQVEKVVDLLNEFEAKCHKLKKDNEKLQELVDVSMKADEVFSVFDDLKYIESALTFLIDNGLESQCVECEREDIHFVAERLRIVLRSLDNE